MKTFKIALSGLDWGLRYSPSESMNESAISYYHGKG